MTTLYVFFLQVLSGYVEQNPEMFATGLPTLDQMVYAVLSTAMFVAGLSAAILDNTIPGMISDILTVQICKSIMKI